MQRGRRAVRASWRENPGLRLWLAACSTQNRRRGEGKGSRQAQTVGGLLRRGTWGDGGPAARREADAQGRRPPSLVRAASTAHRPVVSKDCGEGLTCSCQVPRWRRDRGGEDRGWALWPGACRPGARWTLGRELPSTVVPSTIRRIHKGSQSAGVFKPTLLQWFKVYYFGEAVSSWRRAEANCVCFVHCCIAPAYSMRFYSWQI